MTGRLSVLAAAWVVARRDFVAILFSRTFLFFLLGPLFPVILAGIVGSMGESIERTSERPALGVAMQSADAEAMLAARRVLAERLGPSLPQLRVIKRLQPGKTFDAPASMRQRRANIAAVLTGTPTAPVLTGPKQQVEAWAGDVSMIAAQAGAERLTPWPEVKLETVASSAARERKGRLRTAQTAQTLLFLLTMMLAGMVLSNLVEEKANKIIEVLAAAIPMEAVFLGKLFAMLGISLVGIVTWGIAGGVFLVLDPGLLGGLPVPAVGWPLLIVLGVVYFSMAYLLLGSVFLSIGSLATTVREVQTLSMPVTMIQVLVFFLASFAMTQPGSPVEIGAAVFPFSSPFAMLARGAQEAALWPHLVAVLWQGLCVLVLVRIGSFIFRTRVMKSGPATGRKWWRRRTAQTAREA